MSGLRLAVTLLRNRDLRRVLAGLSAHGIAEHGTWLALMVYAYERGGVRETGIVLFALLFPAIGFAPIAATFDHGGRPMRALVAGFVAQGVTLSITGVAMLTEAHWAVVYLAAFVSAMSLLLTRPMVAATLPPMARSLEELTAATATSNVVGTAGLFTGPALAGIVLSFGPPAAVFIVAAVLMLVVAIPVAATSLQRRRDEQSIGDSPGQDVPVEDMPGEEPAGARGLRSGLRALREVPDSWLLVGVISLVFLATGALDVAFVAVALELLNGSDSTVGALNAAMGFGALTGAMASLRLVGCRRLTPPIALGVLAVGAAVAASAASGSVSLTIVLFALGGIGKSIATVAGMAMLQGLATDELAARIFGLLEGASMTAIAVGALAFAFVADGFSVPIALVSVGAFLALAIAGVLTRLMAIDRQRPTIDPTLVSAVRSVPAFAPLPAYSVERLLASIELAEFGPNERVVTLGEPGEHLHLVLEGDCVVTRSDHTERVMRSGEHFGEIALLLDRPRTATIDAGATGLTTLAIDRATFHSAIGVNPKSLARLERAAKTRLASDTPRP